MGFIRWDSNRKYLLALLRIRRTRSEAYQICQSEIDNNVPERNEIVNTLITLQTQQCAQHTLFSVYSQANSTTEALNMLVFAERMAGALGRGSVWQRRVWLQVGLVLLGVFAYLGAVAFVVVLSESSAAEDSAAVADPNGRATELWGLAHISSLPLQLFFCLLFGDQVSAQKKMYLYNFVGGLTQ
ncbi:uncharacterized protein LOC117652690 [Thrips palmi]|uniref:Uncharacterized protein LOC117652690 n=1 Tax=Thrips palmi TaxID=161013 RepID=A0A6P9A6S8_THRPL|nr:uncharacterized protein LOC117652690 [Thrips palmi]